MYSYRFKWVKLWGKRRFYLLKWLLYLFLKLLLSCLFFRLIFYLLFNILFLYLLFNLLLSHVCICSLNRNKKFRSSYHEKYLERIDREDIRGNIIENMIEELREYIREEIREEMKDFKWEVQKVESEGDLREETSSIPSLLKVLCCFLSS